MAELNVRHHRQVRPDAVYMAVVLWWTAAGLTMVPALIGLYDTLGRVGWNDRLLIGFVLGVALVIVAIRKFDRGQPVARTVLTGLAVYYAWTLVVGLTVITAGKADGLIVVFLIEAARTATAIAAAILAFTPRARKYFDQGGAPGEATRWPAWLWGVGIAALALQFGAEFIDSLPSNGRSWTRWATGSNALGDALLASFLLCLVPAYASIARQFYFARQWARVTLTVLGVVAAVLATVQVLDALDRSSVSDLAALNAVFAAIQVLATVGAIVWSYLPAVNADFRRR
ncbi:hypothetical protein LWC34_47275 [Kibdelosporangium philippinense]|uniref:Uncharacterized protein n=1 Tax=Kibdelosporangium philippinense TaxID=211113 RepID=A0ABS8ZRX6_9PSEU|nr:hypothetical protein [Kibdelosporangium philippinense]MCE7010357.1 hypothetical protein [Kibdelosporangium philippinense]